MRSLEAPDTDDAQMLFRHLIVVAALVAALLTSAGCASLQGGDPLQVTVAGIEPQQGQGLELRMLVKLRVQNPNDAAVAYDGVSVEMNVQGKTFATGVSDARGSVPALRRCHHQCARHHLRVSYGGSGAQSDAGRRYK